MNQVELANKAGTSRSTVINAEDESKTVRFSTVALLMKALGFDKASNEMREVALLWLEAETGVRFEGMTDALIARHAIISGEQVRNSDLLDELSVAIAVNGLSPSHIQLLTWAVSRPPALEILDFAKQLENYPERGERAVLRVAEDQASYDAGSSAEKPKR